MDEIWLSWSRLRSHEECKQKSYLQRERKKLAIQNDRNFTPGNVTDRVVRDWLLDDPWNNLGKMSDMVPEYLQKVVDKSKESGSVVLWKNPNDQKDIIKDCVSAVTAIEESLIKYVLPFEYTPDYAFKVPLTLEPLPGKEINLVLNGYMDILVKHSDGNYFIFDVKHTKDKNYWKKTIGQLAFYDTALYLSEGHYSKFSALLQPLTDPIIKPFNIKEPDRQKMWQSISSYAYDVMKNDTTPTSDLKECGSCFFRLQCAKFKPKMINGKKVVSL